MLLYFARGTGVYLLFIFGHCQKYSKRGIVVRMSRIVLFLEIITLSDVECVPVAFEIGGKGPVEMAGRFLKSLSTGYINFLPLSILLSKMSFAAYSSSSSA